jgi:hypothetical protein
VAHDWVLGADPVRAEGRPRLARDRERLANVFASFCWVSWNDAIGLPNCTRVFEY